MFSKFKINRVNLYFLRVCLALFMVPSLVPPSVPASANGLTQMAATALRRTLWDNTLRESNTLDDIWNRLKQSVDIRMSEIEIPDTVFMQFMTPPPGTHKITVGMTTPLKMPFQEGTDEHMLGNEEQLELLHLSLRYNEIKKAVAHRGWGIEYNDLSSTGLYGTINPKFSKAWSELRGRRIREALMLTYASELTKAPCSLKQQFNSNVYIPNLTLGDQPVWDVSDLTLTTGEEPGALYQSRTFSGENTYVEELAYKMLKASGVGSYSKAYMDVGMLTDLELYVRTRLKLMPVTIGKRRGYLFLVPSDVAAYLTNPDESGSMGSVWKATTALSIEEQSIPGMLGRFKNLWFVEDERAPTLTVSGALGTHTLQPGFMHHGDVDDRNLNPWAGEGAETQNFVFDVGTVVGAGALAEWIVNPLAYARESTEYGQLLGKGSYMCGGIQLARFDVDTPDDGYDSAGTGRGKTIMQRGSCMVLISRKPTSTLRSTFPEPPPIE